VYVGELDVLEAITGFHLHRGALAAMHRPALRPVVDLPGAPKIRDRRRLHGRATINTCVQPLKI